MKDSFALLFAFIISLTIQGQNIKWPVLKHYDEHHISKVAMPVGGIGTGTVSINGRGSLVDWEIMNRPGKGFSTVTPGNDAPFFAIHIQDGEKSHTKGLMGPLLDHEYEHMEGRPVDHHGIPRFEKANFDAAYPFGVVNLSDNELPVEVKIKTFNPLIPGDADASGIPIAILRYEVSNKTDKPITVSVCGSIRNFIGKDGSKFHYDWKGDKIFEGAVKNTNKFRSDANFQGIFFQPGEVDKADPAWGTIALTTDAASGISYRTSSVRNDWSNSLCSISGMILATTENSSKKQNSLITTRWLRWPFSTKFRRRAHAFFSSFLHGISPTGWHGLKKLLVIIILRNTPMPGM
jgi:non-lysosomal glucosylceramidase